MKIVTYNIDGLPETLDLKDLPWIFQPFVWIYQLFAKTTLIYLNDNAGRFEATKKISTYLKDFDIVGIQEDFNYHEALISDLKDKNWGTFQGAIDFSKIFSMVKRFRYKSDGLNIITKLYIDIISENIVEWKDSCGYFSHCNDKLTRKGFRRYLLRQTTDNKYFVVYILHADASEDEDDTKDSETRRKQFTQLAEYIKQNECCYPILVIGDTNCTSNNVDKKTIRECFIEPLIEDKFSVEQALPNDDLDRIFVVNNKYLNDKIIIKNCEHGIEGLSDHRPFIVEFDIVSK